jgi:hypothetical protein
MTETKKLFDFSHNQKSLSGNVTCFQMNELTYQLN